MSLLGLLLFFVLATGAFLAVVLAFARAVLYANVLTELDDAHEIQRRLRSWRRTAGGNERREILEPVERVVSGDFDSCLAASTGRIACAHDTRRAATV